MSEPNTQQLAPLNATDAADLAKRFTYHPPKGDQPSRYVAIREKAKEFAETVLRASPSSRERSLALTHIEETCFWANAGIARNE